MVTEKHPREKMMVRDLDVTRLALHAENREVERLWLCLTTMETALTIADRETAAAEAAAG